MRTLLSRRLRQLRIAKDLTQEELASKLNIARGTLANWEVGRTTPDPETMQLLADFFGVSTDYLLGRTDDPHGTYLPRNAWAVSGLVRVPILGTIRAGMPLYAEGNIEGYVEVAAEDAPDGEYFFLRVVGDSMINARIFDGDLAFVRRQDYAETGDIVAVIINGEEATLKKVEFKGDCIFLHPANPKYETMSFCGKERQEVHIIGKVLWVRGNPYLWRQGT